MPTFNLRKFDIDPDDLVAIFLRDTLLIHNRHTQDQIYLPSFLMFLPISYLVIELQDMIKNLFEKISCINH
jgi:hypothetical protein